jgi:hypothetical protein
MGAHGMGLFRKLFGGEAPARAPAPAPPAAPNPPSARADGENVPISIVVDEERSQPFPVAAPEPGTSGSFEVGPFTSPFQLVGFTLAHAALTASQLKDGAPLMPLAVVQREGKTRLTRFIGETQFDAITTGKAYMAQLAGTADAWAFARDGLWSNEGVAGDAISVDFWVRGMNNPATIVQLYEPVARFPRFRLVGNPMLIAQGRVRTDDKAELTVATILQGVEANILAAPRWQGWKKKD